MSGTLNPVSCVECQRRKQKCNRQFPCQHCSKREVAHLCRFVTKASKTDDSRQDFSQSSRTSKKRNLDSPDDDDLYEEADLGEGDASDALSALGYMPHHHHLVLGNGSGPKSGRDPSISDDGGTTWWSDELKAAMMTMPAKPYADCLVDNWLSGANHHYYALYPPEFRTQYDGWWATPPQKVSPELTSLILRVCACSAQFIMDDAVRERLESELRADTKTFASRMHAAASKLSASMAPGKGGLVQVQQQFLTAFWLKSAQRWTEAWHALGTAIRSANEIGLHQDSLSEGLSEFDREMRRRLWVVLYLWDFALGSMLSRPLMINSDECTLVMPTLALESDPEHPDQPSPFRHMCLHGQLCHSMATGMACSKNENDPHEVARTLRAVTEKWFNNLPREYSLTSPDTRWDKEHDWVVFQRCYLHLIGYLCLFATLKPYVNPEPARPASEDLRDLRAAAVQAALGLMDISWVFFEVLTTAGAKFHYAVFCIFDTATVMCSGLVHDEARNLPQRQEVIEAIRKGLRMLEELKAESKTTAKLCRILKSLLASLPLTAREKGLVGAPKRAKASRDSRGNSNSSGGSSGNLPQKLLLPRDDTAGIRGSEAIRSMLSLSGDSSSGGSSLPQYTTISSIHSSSDDNAADSRLPQAEQPMNKPVWVSGLTPAHAILAPVELSGIPEHGPVEMPIPSMGAPDPAPVPVPEPAPVQDVLPQSLPQLEAGAQAQAQPQPQLELQLVDWNLDAEMLGQMQRFQSNTTEIVGFAGEPAILDYWDWQGLDLGNPGLWADPQVAFGETGATGPPQLDPNAASLGGHYGLEQ